MGRAAKVALCVALTLFIWDSRIAATAGSRVVIIPGIMGSKLCDSAGEIIWGDIGSYHASRINALRLPPDPATRDKRIKSCGLIDRISYIPLLWETDIYSGLIAKVRALGYRDEDIILFD